MKMIQVKRLTTLLVLLLISSITAFADNDELTSTISGKVITADGKPAADVTVTIKGTNKATLTDREGNFSFKNITNGMYVIEISFTGYETISQTITVNNNKSNFLSFQLKLSEKQLEEVIVKATERKFTAGRLSIPEKDMPLTIGSVSNKIITDQQAIRIGDIVKNVPGVSLTQTRFGVNETYAARGYSIGITGGAGGGSIFKNGLPVNIAGIPEAVGIESVEIVKGSSAFLYGSSSGGLIINMVTKKPKYNFGGEVLMHTGSNQQYKPVIDVYGPINKNVAYRFVGSYENDNSFRDVVKTKRVYINPSVLYKFGKNSSLLIQGDYLNAQLTPDPGVGLLDSGRVLTKAIPRSRFQNVAWAYNNVIQNSASAEFKHTINDKFSFNVLASYQNTDVDSYSTGNLNTASTTGIVARPLARAHSVEKDYAVQANIDGKFNTGKITHHFLAGADFTNITTYTDAFTILTSTGATLKIYDTINLLNPNQYVQRTDIPNAIKATITTAPSNRAGVYVQDLVTLTNQFKLFVGLRYTYQATVQTTIDSMPTSTRPAAIVKGTTPTTTYNVLSPKAGIVYQPSQNTSLFVSYANNFTTNSGTDVYGNLLPASIINQYEAGVKNSFLNGRINTTVSIYRILNSNLAQQAQYKADGVTLNTDATVKTLSGETTSDGIELGINAMLSQNLYFITGYSYNFIRYTHTSGSKGSNIEGEQLVNAPSNTANASIFYTFSSGSLKNIKLGATGFYTGSRFGGYNNTVGQTVLGSRMVALSGFTTVDLSAGYTYKKFTLQCKLSNIFNALNYLVHDNYSISPIAPRQLMTTLSYRF
jgi:iron complex outermembrane recepter protein